MITIVRREIHVHTFGEKVVFITAGGGAVGGEAGDFSKTVEPL